MPETFDLVIVGGGTSGLAAAISAAAAGVRVLVVERAAPGGAARSHARIESVPAHPVGLSGAEFVDRSLAQATRFGAEFRINTEAIALDVNGDQYTIALDDGSTISTTAVLLAMGADTPVALPALERFAGSGLYTAVPLPLPEALRGQDVFVAGTPALATQVARTLQPHCRSVTLLCVLCEDGSKLTCGFTPELHAATNIAIKPQHEIVDAFGVERIEAVTLRDRRSGRTTIWTAAAVFVVGAEAPRTGWLAHRIALDDRSFVVTATHRSSAARRPYAHEASLPGVFAAGATRCTPASIAAAIDDGIGAARDAVHYINDIAARSRTHIHARRLRPRNN